jgi:hypothetical protein
VLCLPAMAVAPGWAAGLLCLLFFGLILAVFAQLWKLRATGLCVTVEDVVSETDTAEEFPEEETPAEPEVQETPEAPQEPAPPEMHWSDMAYPDPDVELGLREESPESSEV